jgi:hypothetical protein
MTCLDLAALVFATGAVIEVWNKGSIFSTTRAIIHAKQDATEPDSFKGKVYELLTCPFCQSYHVPFYLFLLLFFGDFIGGSWGALLRGLVFALAVTRISNLIDGFLPPERRYFRPLNPF